MKKIKKQFLPSISGGLVDYNDDKKVFIISNNETNEIIKETNSFLEAFETERENNKFPIEFTKRALNKIDGIGDGLGKETCDSF